MYSKMPKKQKYASFFDSDCQLLRLSANNEIYDYTKKDCI